MPEAISQRIRERRARQKLLTGHNLQDYPVIWPGQQLVTRTFAILDQIPGVELSRSPQWKEALMLWVASAALLLALGSCTAARPAIFSAQSQGPPSSSEPQRPSSACWATSSDGRSAQVLNPKTLSQRKKINEEPPAAFSAMLYWILT